MSFVHSIQPVYLRVDGPKRYSRRRFRTRRAICSDAFTCWQAGLLRVQHVANLLPQSVRRERLLNQLRLPRQYPVPRKHVIRIP